MTVVQLEDGSSIDAGSIEIHDEWVVVHQVDEDDWLYLPARRVSEIAASHDEKDDPMGVEILD